jgi:hypothetical protein
MIIMGIFEMDDAAGVWAEFFANLITPPAPSPWIFPTAIL